MLRSRANDALIAVWVPKFKKNFFASVCKRDGKNMSEMVRDMIDAWMLAQENAPKKRGRPKKEDTARATKAKPLTRESVKRRQTRH